MKKVVSLLLVFLMLLNVVACGNSAVPETTTAPDSAVSAAPAAAPVITPATGEPILIGVSCMDTGSQAGSGVYMRNAVTLAIEEINASGGVLDGRPLEFIVDDNGTTTTGAVTVANKMLSQGIVASIGPHTSPMVSAAMEYYKEEGVPFVSAATSPTLLDAENPYFFRISVSDGAIGPASVQFASDMFDAKKIGILYCACDYGIGADNATRAHADIMGIECYSEGTNEGDTDVSSQLLKIRDWGPDVIFLFTHNTDSALALRQINELGINTEVPILGPNALSLQQTLDLTDSKEVDGVYCSTDYFPDTDNTVIAEFIERFANRWDGMLPERIAVMYYSAAYLIADAINRAGSDDPAAIRDALAQTTGLDTPAGNLNCTDKLELNSNIYILRYDGNKVASVAKKVVLE